MKDSLKYAFIATMAVTFIASVAGGIATGAWAYESISAPAAVRFVCSLAITVFVSGFCYSVFGFIVGMVGVMIGARDEQ